MADSTPQLKRKRETAEAQRKKAKTLQRKSDASASLDESETIAATPVVATPKSKSTPKNKSEPHLTPKSAQTSKDAPANTPSTARKGKKDQKAQTPGAKNKVKKDKKPEGAAESDALVKVDTAAGASDVLPSSPAKAKKQKAKAPAKWLMSSGQGGWFLPSDPVFSPDEKFMILATLRSLDIYFTETSLLAYKLPVGGSGSLTAYALSATNPTQVYVADSTGLITLWDWVLKQKVGRWDIGTTVRNMTVIAQSEPAEDLVYCHEPGNSHIINVHALRTGSQASKTELKRILKSTSPVLGLQVLLQGRFVIAACANSIMVGKRQKPSKTAVQDFEYVWRELKFAHRITTFNAYVREPETTGKGVRNVNDQRDVIDIATGDDSGVVFLFEDILATFAAVESSQKGGKSKADNAESLRPKKFHWHREAVGSVKWSLDGNYLISGGDETVLTIWQLATGKMQHLPHLTAAIENIVVSPSGSSYAISLANNSVIVISTTELEAKTNIVGVQSRRVDMEQLPRESSSSRPSFGVFHPVPMAVNPKNPREVLFSVPSSQPRQRPEGLCPEPYLQTFDLANQHSISKQALARNNATDPNMGPEGRRIIEPSVKLLQVSQDGEWLATVDEWIPPRTDMAYLDEGIPEFNEEERTHRREVYLKFWRRDGQSGQWKLETRIDAPHFFQDVSANGRVFDLVADPTGPGFATVGEDHFVRIWRPKTRLRDGITVRGADTAGLVTWALDRSIEISDKLDILDVCAGSQQSLPLRASRLAFSADGSVVAAAISWASESDPGVTHLIDANAAAIQRSITEVDVTALSGLAILDRHLIVIGDSITVWDMVLDQLVYCVPINTPGVDLLERVSLLRFAINAADGTFAVSLPQFESNSVPNMRFKKASSKIIVFSPERQEALWSTKASGITLALASRQSERGYVVLDSTSCVRVISPTGSALQLPTPSAEVEAAMPLITYAQQKEDTEMEEEVSAALSSIDDLVLNSEHDDVIVKPEQLQQMFEESGPSHAMGSPSGLFSAIIGLRRGVAVSA